MIKKITIKNKITQHEFDFSDQAWEKMDKLLDDAKEPKKTIIPFFNLRNTLIMIGLFLVVISALLITVDGTQPATRTRGHTAHGLMQADIDNIVVDNSNPIVNKNIDDFDNEETEIIQNIKKSKAITKEENIVSVVENEDTKQAIKNHSRRIQIKDNSSIVSRQPSTVSRLEKTYIFTDRPMYKPGESIWFSVFVRDALTNEASTMSKIVYVEWLLPNGNVDKKLTLLVKNGVAKGDIQLKDGVNGGLYKLRAYTNWQRNSEDEGTNGFTKEITVQKAVLPNLRMELNFVREAYGANDEVIANLELKSMEDAPLSDYEFKYQVNLDGNAYANSTGKTDAIGRAKVKFNLPKTLTTNDGLLNVVITYNGQNESISRNIPIVLNDVDLQFLPESGQILANATNKIAFKAMNEFGKPADITGEIRNSQNELITTFTSYHQGMGAVVFENKIGETYTAKITKPQGINRIYELPKAVSNGFAIRILEQNETHLKIQIETGERKDLKLVARTGDKIYHTTEFKNRESNQHLIEIETSEMPIGIITLTLFDEKGLSQAERLAFVNKDKRLNIEMATDKKKYLPRERVDLNISVKDHKGRPVQGNFAMSVVDDKLLSFADDKQCNILSQILLQSELTGEIEKPNFYFDAPSKHPEKDQKLALDYLMLTQGWRTFDWNKTTEPKFKNENLAIRGIVMDIQGQPLDSVKFVISAYNFKGLTDENGVFEYQHDDYLNPNVTVDLYYNGISKRKTLMTSEVDTIKMISNGDKGYYDNGSVIFAINSDVNSTNTMISGEIIDKDSYEPLIFANIALYENDVIHYQGETDFDGRFTINNIKPGHYQFKVTYTGYSPFSAAVSLNRNEALNLDIHMQAGIDVDVLEILYVEPMISHDMTTQGVRITSEDIIRSPNRVSSKIAQRKQEIARKKALEQRKKAESEKTNVDKARKEAERLVKMQAAQKIAEASRQKEAKKLLAGKVKGKKDLEDLMNKDSRWMSNDKASVTASQKTGKYTEQVLIKEPSSRIEIIPAEYETVTETVLAKAESKRLMTVPAEYQTVTETIEVSPATTKWVKRQANKNCLSADPNDCQVWALVEVPARYETITKTVLVTPATTKEVTVPAEYQTITKRVVKTPTASIMVEVPAEYKTVTVDFAKDYNRALNFKNGKYEPRVFFMPAYKAQEDGDAPINRSDFRSTVHWEGNIETDSLGQAQVVFWNSDAITTFKATLEGFGKDGSIGRNEMTYFTQLPFGMMAKVLTIAVTGDIIQIPLTLMNNSDKKLKGKLSVIAPNDFELTAVFDNKITLKPYVRKTIYLSYQVLSNAQDGDFQISFDANGLNDAFEQPIEVLQRGFPQNITIAGKEKRAKYDFEMSEPMDNSLNSEFTIYPNVIEDIVESAKQMLRQPTGCFEQTSSTNYPNLLVLDYLRSTNTIDRETEGKAMEYLKAGYNRLISYEVKGGGFDWFGRPPAHETLTAYGLMQFVDMKSVYDVDQALIDRTANWLLSRKDEKGSWKLSKRGLHSWTGVSNTRDAYIVWAMCESNYGKDIPMEMEKSFQDAEQTKDPYLMALMANALFEMNDARAINLVEELLTLQNENGSWVNKDKTITYSYGKSGTIETTALTTLAMLKMQKRSESGDYKLTKNIENAIQYIISSKNGVGFGTTQSTVLAMKALIEHAKQNPTLPKSGSVTLFVNNKKVGEQGIEETQREKIVFKNYEKHLQVGKNTIKVVFNGMETAFNYDFSLNYNTIKPINQPECLVRLNTELNTNETKMGETVRLKTTLINTTSEAIPNTIAIVGIPSGLSLQPWQLKQLQEREVFDYYELMDGYIIFHYREMQADEVKVIDLDLKADIPGKYEAPASSAYLYYTNEYKYWAQPLKVEIQK